MDDREPPVPGLLFHGVEIPEICQTFWSGMAEEVGGWRWGVRDAKGVEAGSEDDRAEYLRVCRALAAAGVEVDFEEEDF